MSFEAFMFRFMAGKSDKKRDDAIPLPEGVTECRNISYGSHGNWNLLDVYYPEGTSQPLPTIVSIHGGGYVYGSKEIYRRYGMDMARRGFAFVNFNYRLAPKWKFPTPPARYQRGDAVDLQKCHPVSSGSQADHSGGRFRRCPADQPVCRHGDES